MTLLRTGLVLGLIVMTQGCTAPSTDLRGEWTTALTDLGLVPVMPPREDIRVGDLFLTSDPATGGSLNTLAGAASSDSVLTRWSSVPVLDVLEQEYQQRPAFPATPDEFFDVQRDAPSAVLVEPTAPAGQSVFDTGALPNRLPLVGLQALSSMTMADGDALTFAPSEALGLARGPEWRNGSYVTADISSAESSSISLRALLPLLVETGAGTVGTGYRLRAEYTDHLGLVTRIDSTTGFARPLWICAVTEVVYIRSIDVVLNARRDAPDEEVTLSSMATEAPDQAAENGEPAITATDDEPALDSAVAAFLRAETINTTLRGSGADDVPGGRVRFLSVSEDSVVARRMWRRGLAVGTRGIALRVDPATGDVLEIRPLGN